MNEESTLDVKIVRVGGSTGTITALLQPNPGTAIRMTSIRADHGDRHGRSQTEFTAQVTTRRTLT
ncbi:MAG: hypothetical protein ACLTCB_01580 [Merdibacter sp.]